jgi:hypothetical protein
MRAAGFILIAGMLTAAIADVFIGSSSLRLPLTWAKVLWPAAAVEDRAERITLYAAPVLAFAAGAVAGWLMPLMGPLEMGLVSLGGYYGGAVVGRVRMMRRQPRLDELRRRAASRR